MGMACMLCGRDHPHGICAEEYRTRVDGYDVALLNRSQLWHMWELAVNVRDELKAAQTRHLQRIADMQSEAIDAGRIYAQRIAERDEAADAARDMQRKYIEADRERSSLLDRLKGAHGRIAELEKAFNHRRIAENERLRNAVDGAIANGSEAENVRLADLAGAVAGTDGFEYWRNSLIRAHENENLRVEFEKWCHTTLADSDNNPVSARGILDSMRGAIAADRPQQQQAQFSVCEPYRGGEIWISTPEAMQDAKRIATNEKLRAAWEAIAGDVALHNKASMVAMLSSVCAGECGE